MNGNKKRCLNEMAFKTKAVSTRLGFTLGWYLGVFSNDNVGYNQSINLLIQLYLYLREYSLSKQQQLFFFHVIYKQFY